MTVLSRSKNAALRPTAGSVAVQVGAHRADPSTSLPGSDRTLLVLGDGYSTCAVGSGMLMFATRFHVVGDMPAVARHIRPSAVAPPVAAEWVRLNPPGAGPPATPVSPPRGSSPSAPVLTCRVRPGHAPSASCIGASLSWTRRIASHRVRHLVRPAPPGPL